MRLWFDPPGVPLEQGRYTALVAPPEPLLGLLGRPELDRFMTLYLYGISSRLLHRLPRRAPALEVQSCMTIHQLLVALQEAYHSIVLVEYDPELFSAIEGEQQEVVHAAGQALSELARSSLVLLYVGRADRGFRALSRPADQVVYLYGALPPSRAEAPARAVGGHRRPAQRTLAETGWG